MKRTLVAGLCVLVVAAAGVIVAGPTLDQRCQRWYHHVRFYSSQHTNKVGSGSIQPDVWDAAVAEVGAKPFYCS